MSFGKSKPNPDLYNINIIKFIDLTESCHHIVLQIYRQAFCKSVKVNQLYNHCTVIMLTEVIFCFIGAVRCSEPPTICTYTIFYNIYNLPFLNIPPIMIDYNGYINICWQNISISETFDRIVQQADYNLYTKL